MELKLYDTLTREKRVFAPIDPARVRMYVCGPTVYDFAHIGNARPVIVFDVLFRLLRHLYGADHVTYVRNITDVDDKINARAAERGISIRELTEETYTNFKADVAALGCLPPTVEPRATEHIAEMKTLIERLVAVRPRLCRRGPRAVQRAVDAGLRQAVEAPARRDDRRRPRRGRALQARPDGFRAVEAVEAGRAGLAVAVPASRRRAGPAGTSNARRCRGSISARPSTSTAAASISSSRTTRTRSRNRAAPSTPPVMANYWMHNGFLQVEGEKMSKSLGNFVTIRELLADWPGDVLRLTMLRTHYRQPIDWTVKGLEESREGARRAGSMRRRRRGAIRRRLAPSVLDALARRSQHAEGDRRAARHCADRAQGRARRRSLKLRWRRCILGFLQRRRRRHGQLPSTRRARSIDEAKVEALIAARNAARKAKNFTESDRIRDELAAMGVVLKDSKDGTTWEIAR